MECSHLRRAASTLCALVTLLFAQTSFAQQAKPIDVHKESLESLTVANLVIQGDESETKVFRDEGFRVVVLEELRRLGYPAVGAENLVFDQDRASDARFVLGVTIRDGACARVARSVNCQFAFHWELLDTRFDKVVYKVVTMTPILRIGGESDESIGRKLIFGSLHSLLSRPKFVAAVRGDGAKVVQAFPDATFKRCTASALALPEQAELALASTVLISAGDVVGSGVVISDDGVILTAAHVVEKGNVQVKLRDGSNLVAEVIRTQRDADVALVRVTTSGPLTCAPVAEGAARVGEPVYAIGSPASAELSFSVTRGIVSGLREWQGAKFLQTDASINPGNSGGPMLNERGALLGVVSWKLTGMHVEGVAFGVPIGFALERLSLKAGAATDAALAQGAEAPRDVASVETVIDTPDTKTALDPEGDLRRAMRAATPGWVHPTRWVGIGAVIAGAGLASLSWLRYDPEETTEDDFGGLRTMNTTGWVIAGVGAAAITASYVFSPSKKELERRARVKLGASARSVQVGVQF